MKSPVPKILPALLPLLLLSVLYSLPVAGQQANFTFTATPASLCAPTNIQFQNTSNGFPLAYTWDLGNGSTSYIASPEASYTQPGTYRVTLTVEYVNGTSQVWKDITINPSPAVDFTVNTTTSCKPFTATFTDITPNAGVRSWDFGDGTLQTTNNGSIQHTYTRPGNYNVTLSVTNAFGCTQALTKPSLINIALPAINISGVNLSGCAPVNASLSANVTTINNDPVTQYAWNFGDGSSQSTSLPAATHQYNNNGAFDVTLTVTTQQGCSASLTAGQLVRAGTPPANVSFTATPGTACAGSPVRLLATATNADSYSWDFGDGTTAEGPSNDITHAFRQNGNITVQMRAGRNGCYTSSPPVSVQITGPAAHFSYARSCTNRRQFSFTNTSSSAPGVTYEWDFGDGSPLVFTRDAVHTYTQNGNYTVRLTVKESGGGACQSSDFQTVSCFQPDFITGISSICRGSNIGYGVLNVPHPLVHHYSWRFGDNTRQDVTATDINKAFQQSGIFTDTLIIFYNDPAVYCNDTIVKQQHITILAPSANFNAGQACAGQPVSFSDASQPWPNIPLTNWQWYMGNGGTSGTQTPAPASYIAAGVYNVKLVVTDARNCKDSLTQAITVNPTPYLSMGADTYRICEGNSVTLVAQSDGNLLWTPNTGLSCVACASPAASPVTDIEYFVTATNAFGCAVEDSVSVDVIPQVQLVVRPDTAICAGSALQLWASGAATYNWSPADQLSATNIANPVSTPTADITYTVTGSNDASCPSQTEQVTLQVKPLPSVNAGADQTVTTGSIVTLDATGSADVVRWEWSPADYLNCTVCPYTQAAVRRPISYSVTVTNADGCTKSDIVDIKLVCDKEAVYIPNTFSPNGDGTNDIFYVRGKGVSFIKSFRIFNRWGQEVFKRENITIDDISSGWNGTYKNQPQAADVYVYFIEAYCDTNERFELRGNITLLR
jgi:gliding motility-associated-like protein